VEAAGALGTVHPQLLVVLPFNLFFIFPFFLCAFFPKLACFIRFCPCGHCVSHHDLWPAEIRGEMRRRAEKLKKKRKQEEHQ
jgi:hypothetical protein